MLHGDYTDVVPVFKTYKQKRGTISVLKREKIPVAASTQAVKPKRALLETLPDVSEISSWRVCWS